jgi:hypothetical protein
MAISPQDAAAALHDIERAEARSATLRGYERAAPHFILWGILWAIGYGLSDIFQAHANAIWAAIIPIGIIADFVAVRRAKGGFNWRYGLAVVTFLVFFCAAFFVMAPVNGRQVAAFIPLVVATCYVLVGIWAGTRYVVAGVVIAALTLIGFALLREHFLLWMAVVGAASLILAGLWLKQV